MLYTVRSHGAGHHDWCRVCYEDNVHTMLRQNLRDTVSVTSQILRSHYVIRNGQGACPHKRRRQSVPPRAWRVTVVFLNENARRVHCALQRDHTVSSTTSGVKTTIC